MPLPHGALTRLLALALAATLMLPAAPVAAAEPAGETCSSSMLATVRLQMPPLGRDLDPGQLSCNGLAQVYFLLTQRREHSAHTLRQRIIAVFRGEGLTA